MKIEKEFKTATFQLFCHVQASRSIWETCWFLNFSKTRTNEKYPEHMKTESKMGLKIFLRQNYVDVLRVDSFENIDETLSKQFFALPMLFLK